MDWVNLLQAGLAVGLIVAGGFLGHRRGIIQSLREANTDLRNRRDDLEKDRDEAVADRDKNIADSGKKIADLEGAVRVLTDTVTAKESITELADRLESHHAESMAVLTDIRKALTKGP